MALTEEQRDALDFALEYMIDDPNDDRDFNLANSIRIIQAMIDSSDHIVETNELIGFDLERARGLRDFLQGDCSEVGEVWAEMVTEIERLREDLADSEKRNEDLRKGIDDLSKTIFSGTQAARIKELEDALVEAKAAMKFCLDEGDEDEDYGPYHSLYAWKELPDREKDALREWCRKQLLAEGKIGPGGMHENHQSF